MKLSKKSISSGPDLANLTVINNFLCYHLRYLFIGAEAEKLFKDAEKMLSQIIDSNLLRK